MDPQALAKWLIGLGLLIALVGVVLYVAGHFSVPVGRLPGDIRIDRPHFKFYFPITTCIIISIVLTVIFWIISRFR